MLCVNFKNSSNIWNSYIFSLTNHQVYSPKTGWTSSLNSFTCLTSFLSLSRENNPFWVFLFSFRLRSLKYPLAKRVSYHLSSSLILFHRILFSLIFSSLVNSIHLFNTKSKTPKPSHLKFWYLVNFLKKSPFNFNLN